MKTNKVYSRNENKSTVITNNTLLSNSTKTVIIFITYVYSTHIQNILDSIKSMSPVQNKIKQVITTLYDIFTHSLISRPASAKILASPALYLIAISMETVLCT